ncbi:MAG: NADH-quinone oxidoreductase subunit NuoH [Bacteroidetes bacterium]|nr:NADH-quinone oxidoreductase subunit NuoH [Bacteroidota bacterium]MCA0444799.1 NADH-quinone oxidoreductase subunit NuoH [Bacteroidota bacterium]
MHDLVLKTLGIGDLLAWLGVPDGSLVYPIVASVFPLIFLILFALLAVYAERKVSAFIQNRLGPMETGPWGLFQTVADILKLIQKEDITPTASDKILFFVAPVLVFTGTYASLAVLPWSNGFVGADLNVGIFYLLAISSLVVAGLLMAGWGSNNKWSLYGAVRSTAQIISYEIPAGLAVLTAIVTTGTLNMTGIIQQQEGLFFGYLFASPFLFVAFIIYLIASLAEVNRTPFDLPEAESELVGGYHTEYSGMKFAMFFLSEYGNMFVVSAIAVSVFLGGWLTPWGTVPSYGMGFFWILVKSLFFVFFQMWLRWTLPRFRVDQLMYLCWKVLIPIAFACLIGQAAWVVYL